MADQTILDRLQPSLLDRLTDEAPEEMRENRDSRVINIRKLREILRRDLAWLLNTSNAEFFIDEELFPHAANSVLNYGISKVAGEFSGVEKAAAIRKAIHEAILRFEPRILPNSLHVTLRTEETKTASVVSYDIRADMWAEPLPLEVYLRSEVDVATGELRLDGRG
ncbi:type VI secretion system baseplate subunit TssE [Algicella marina]|uniref:Type VI secretion system baseplate subunit TssE n=1 Tax=Algicella marina TaxID=2683284 RepID=A0A6P1T4B7_9RHOB|nr:type VI secretion system baseplate subunit TssE [Algicella marina]QHQ36550.1 type VI secretion system baseplate subunit TssE [Algicella marina]